MRPGFAFDKLAWYDVHLRKSPGVDSRPGFAFYKLAWSDAHLRKSHRRGEGLGLGFPLTSLRGLNPASENPIGGERLEALICL